MPPRPYAYRTPPELQSSIPLYRHTCSKPPDIDTSISLPLTSIQASIPPYLHVTTPAARLQSATPAAHLQTSMPPCRCTYSASLELHTSIPPYRYTCSAPQSSRHLRLFTSMSLHLQRTSGLRTSTSARLQRASRAPYQPTSASLHLQRGSRPPCLHTSMSLRLQRGSRPPYLYPSIPPYRRTCSAAPEIHTSTSLRLQRSSRAPYLRCLRVHYTLFTTLSPLGSLRSLRDSELPH